MRSNGVCWTVWLLAVVLTTACVAPEAGEAPGAVGEADHAADVQRWRIDRDAALRAPDGWLSLVGLHWLAEGIQTLGSDLSSDVVLPAGPGVVGQLEVESGRATIRVEPGVGLTADGQVISEQGLETDAGGEPTLLRLGSLEFFAIERMGKLALRVKDSKSPLLEDFEGLEYYSAAYGWLKRSRFVEYETPRELQFVDSVGTMTVEQAPGALEFEHGGRTHRIDVRREGDELFVVFGDATNGTETYGGGRFIYTPLPDRNGMVMLDFNRAYNPPCVFTPYATCPRPLPEAILAFPVRAGEKRYRGKGY